MGVDFQAIKAHGFFLTQDKLQSRVKVYLDGLKKAAKKQEQKEADKTESKKRAREENETEGASATKKQRTEKGAVETKSETKTESDSDSSDGREPEPTSDEFAKDPLGWIASMLDDHDTIGIIDQTGYGKRPEGGIFVYDRGTSEDIVPFRKIGGEPFDFLRGEPYRACESLKGGARQPIAILCHYAGHAPDQSTKTCKTIVYIVRQESTKKHKSRSVENNRILAFLADMFAKDLADIGKGGHNEDPVAGQWLVSSFE